jgi:hypothetical protein
MQTFLLIASCFFSLLYQEHVADPEFHHSYTREPVFLYAEGRFSSSRATEASQTYIAQR